MLTPSQGDYISWILVVVIVFQSYSFKLCERAKFMLQKEFHVVVGVT